jgi:hypothetical protein
MNLVMGSDLLTRSTFKLCSTPYTSLFQAIYLLRRRATTTILVPRLCYILSYIRPSSPVRYGVKGFSLRAYHVANTTPNRVFVSRARFCSTFLQRPLE